MLPETRLPLFASVLIFYPYFGVEAACAAARAEDLTQVRAVWEEFQTDISNADIEARFFRRAVHWAAAYSTEDLQTIVSDCIDAEDVHVRSIIETLIGRPLSTPSGPFVRCHILIDGNKYRYEDYHGTILSDGENDIMTNAAGRSVNILSRDDSPIAPLRLADLRWVPGPSLLNSATVSLSDGQILVKNRALQVTVEPGSYFPVKAVFLSTSRGPQFITSIIWQIGRVDNSKGILFPRCRLTADFDEASQLYAFTAIEVISGTFNEALAEGAFDVGVAQGTRVYDYRGRPHSPRFRIARAREPDVAASRSRAQRARAADRAWILSSAALFVALAVLALLAFARKRRHP